MVSGVINHNSYKKIISGCNILRNKMNINDQEKYQPASRSSIWISMNVILTPATANGYSHTDLSPSCFRRRSWKDFYNESFNFQWDTRSYKMDQI